MAHVHKVVRTHRAPECLCLNVEVEEHSLGNLNEPANYKALLLDLESNKWLDAMNAEMQSMEDNQVWRLVDLPPNVKTVVSKWIFKKKTNMDGNVHTYKACLVEKGYTQTYGIDYEETFSPVADIRAIRILIAIAANPKAELRVTRYCDVGFETDRDDIKSQTGYVFVLNGGAIDWKSSKQSTTAMSAIEAKYIAASEAAMEYVWIRNFISGLGIVPTINEPIKML
ncbi:retrotransposon protein, putative, ty1-copia subclass [Tanacetum coccineum]